MVLKRLFDELIDGEAEVTVVTCSDACIRGNISAVDQFYNVALKGNLSWGAMNGTPLLESGPNIDATDKISVRGTQIRYIGFNNLDDSFRWTLMENCRNMMQACITDENVGEPAV